MHKLLFFAAAIMLMLGTANAHAFDISGTGSIYKASDGDTFWVTGIEEGAYKQLWAYSQDPRHFNHKYRSVKMRIGGVDTAESVHHNKALNTAHGATISDHMKDVATNQSARFRCWTIGKYKRPICAVSLDNIGDIGLYLIRNDFSPYVTRFGRHPYLHNAYVSAAR